MITETVRYSSDKNTAYFDEQRFTRDKQTGYYLSSSRFAGERKRLHRYVWEFYHGPIPEGFHVHHVNGNKYDNDIGNLELEALA